MRNEIPGAYRPQRPLSPVRWLLVIAAIFLIVAISIFAVVYFGIYNHSVDPTPTATSTGTTNNDGPCSLNSPYGFTTVNVDAQLVTLYKQLNVCWVRYQVHWAKIETSPGVYDWSQVDTAVQLMNSSHIYVDFAIESAPLWERSTICIADGKNYLPGPKEMANFATRLATRYNGKHGHGHIDSFEIGNEEYDQHYTGSQATSESCRQGSTYGPILKAGYPFVRYVVANHARDSNAVWISQQAHLGN